MPLGRGTQRPTPGAAGGTLGHTHVVTNHGHSLGGHGHGLPSHGHDQNHGHGGISEIPSSAYGVLGPGDASAPGASSQGHQHGWGGEGLSNTYTDGPNASGTPGPSPDTSGTAQPTTSAADYPYQAIGGMAVRY
jgi:hypothetical protein